MKIDYNFSNNVLIEKKIDSVEDDRRIRKHEYTFRATTNTNSTLDVNTFKSITFSTASKYDNIFWKLSSLFKK